MPGLGMAVGQDIMVRARRPPGRDLAELDGRQLRALCHEIVEVVREVTEVDGRNDGRHLSGDAGLRERLADAGPTSQT